MCSLGDHFSPKKEFRTVWLQGNVALLVTVIMAAQGGAVW